MKRTIKRNGQIWIDIYINQEEVEADIYIYIYIEREREREREIDSKFYQVAKVQDKNVFLADIIGEA